MERFSVVIAGGESLGGAAKGVVVGGLFDAGIPEGCVVRHDEIGEQPVWKVPQDLDVDLAPLLKTGCSKRKHGRDEVADEVRKNIVEYVESILEKHTTYNKSLQSRKGSVDRLDDLSETISRLILNSSRDLVVFEHLVNQYRRFRDARGKRNRNSDFRLPDALNRFLQMSSFLIIAVFMLVGYQSLLSSVVSVGALTFLLTFVHLIILDLDDPLSGYWRIEFESFSLLKSRLDGK